MSEMKYRDAGCVYCRQLTSGDCGKHGPLIFGSVAFGPPGNVSPAPFTIKPLVDLAAPLKARIAELERHQAEAAKTILFLHAAVVKIWSYIADAQEGMNPFPPMAKLTEEAIFDLVSKAEQLCCDTAESKEYAAALQRARGGGK